MSWWKRVEWLAVMIPFIAIFCSLAIIFSPADRKVGSSVLLFIMWSAMIYILMPRRQICMGLVIINGRVYYPGESWRYFFWLRYKINDVYHAIESTPVDTLLHCTDIDIYARVSPGSCHIRPINLENLPRELDVKSFTKKVNAHLAELMTEFSKGKTLAETMLCISNDNYDTNIDGFALEWEGNTIFRFDLEPEEES